MTPKQKVLAKWPLAFVADWGFRKEKCIRVNGPDYSGDNWDTLVLGDGPTEEAAWADAAKRMEGK